ncbi:hypothetical protein HK414_15825 [Ramlibacter terrae]|uniref:Uncharacterized protein n=1 Tax=Ramlibacter terrae TaxID=2732511 RepID=A0ABX6P3H3_9BURK|nr:hypothetical protein HK414_15825 [Ramlibacter terrae]
MTANGNMLLDAVNGSVSIDTAVLGSGHISIVADGDMLVNADVEAGATGKTIDLYAGGSILQASGTTIATVNGNIALDAGDDVQLVSLEAGTAGVWISALQIVDGDGVGDAEVDIVAASAQLIGMFGIGAAGSAIATDVDLLTAYAPNGGLFITEADGLTIGTTELNVRVVDEEGNVSATENDAQEGLLAETVVLTVTEGDLDVTAGELAGIGAFAPGDNLRLEAVAGSVSLAGFVAAVGDLSVLADEDIAIAAEAFVVSALGSVDLQAGGSIAMAADSVVATDGVDIALRAGGDITVGMVDARLSSDRDADPQTMDDRPTGAS